MSGKVLGCFRMPSAPTKPRGLVLVYSVFAFGKLMEVDAVEILDPIVD